MRLCAALCAHVRRREEKVPATKSGEDSRLPIFGG